MDRKRMKLAMGEVGQMAAPPLVFSQVEMV